MRRSVGMIIFIVIVSAVIGSALSFFLSKIFPSGPVYSLLCKAFSVGIDNISLNLGFLSLSFGLTLSITGLTVLFIILALILLNRF